MLADSDFRLLPFCVLLSYCVPGWAQQAALRFERQEMPFVLSNSETPQKHLPETTPGGIAAFDYDNDGDIDLYFTNGAEMPSLEKTAPRYWNRLYRNTGSGKFEDVTADAGVSGEGYDIGAAVGDYDNDGDLDLFVAGVYRNTLFENNGDGTFGDVTAKSGLSSSDRQFGPLWSVAASWVDFDNDGDLDLFVVNYCVWNPKEEKGCIVDGKADYCHPRNYAGLPNSLYRNDGDGTLTDVSSALGIRTHVGKGMSAAVADYDRDGWVDIFVTNDKEFNFLFHNEQGKGFSEVALEAGVAVPADGNAVSGMGADFRDVNNDGLPDIFFTALPDETFPLFLNTGKGWFDEATYSYGLSLMTRTMAGWSTGIYDFDNDGWKDVFVSRSEVLSATGSMAVRAKQPNSLFRNDKGRRLHDLTAASGLGSTRQMYRGAAFGDFNGDGKIDVAVSALNANAEIWLNASPAAGQWLALRLEGRRSNCSAIGARVQLTTESGSQFNQVTTSVGYASSSAGPVHFGLGAETRAAKVRIDWPSGAVQELVDVPAGSVTVVREPDLQPER